MKLTNSEFEKTEELAQVFRERFGAEEIILYGSAARDELEEGSDIDLLVVLPKVDWETEKKISDICFSAELECGRVFSVICYSVEELEHSPLRVSPLVLNARREGRPL